MTQRHVALLATITFTVFAAPLLADDRFRQAIGPREWSFPRDHGRHDGFQTEWWYFTGNLAADDGRRFGYQLTFFRSQVAAQQAAATTRPSGWAMRDLYFAHAAISDLGGRRFAFRDRIARGREGLAGASDRTLDVHLLDWRAWREDDGTLRLVARDGDFAIDLTGVVERGPVLQGDRGLSPKGRRPGQASYYYSLTRIRTTGTLRLAGESFAVSGLSWMDQEFSSNVLDESQVGWDWLSLQLDDGRDLMVFRLRDASGRTDYASATLVLPDGSTRTFTPEQIRMAGTDEWTSPASGGRYPQRWTIDLDTLGTFTIRTAFPEQELVTTNSTDVSYFEGAIEAIDDASRVIGRGYLEMTGYAKPLQGGF